MKNTYRLPRAEITIERGERSPLLPITKLMIEEQLTLYKSRLKAPNVSLGDKELYKFKIREARNKRRLMESEKLQITIKLTEPRFCGHSNVFNLEQRPEQRLIGLLRDKVVEVIRHYRLVHSDVPITVQEFAGIFVNRMGQGRGKVFADSNEIFKAYIRKHVQELYKDKKPNDADKYIGVELEFCAATTRDDLSIKLFKAGLHKFAQLKDDGSLRPMEKECGFEIALLLKESQYKKDLKKVLDVLKSVGAVAEDRRCGLHIHLDMRKRNKALVYNNLVACQKVLQRLVDPRRYNNEFCKFVKSKKFPENFTGNRAERYRTINAAAYYKYQTLEVRMLEGSVDFTHISGWTDLLIKIANCRKKLTKNVSSLTMLKKMLKLNEKMYTYAVDRNCYWQLNGKAPNIARPPSRSRVFTDSAFNVPTEMTTTVPIPADVPF